MKQKNLKQIIESWQFASCPTEERELFLWRWTEEGLDMLESYINTLIQEARTEKDREWTGFLRGKIRIIK